MATLRADPELVADLRAESARRVALSEPLLPQRYDLAVRYSREFGWLEVRDPFTGGWHEIRMAEAPPSWRRAAAEEKKRRKLALVTA